MIGHKTYTEDVRNAPGLLLKIPTDTKKTPVATIIVVHTNIGGDKEFFFETSIEKITVSNNIALIGW
jgi:hypothetical protein